MPTAAATGIIKSSTQSSNYTLEMKKSVIRLRFLSSYIFNLLLYFTDLTVERFCMTGGKSPIGYLKAYMTNLYLSKDAAKVTEAIEEGKSDYNPGFHHAHTQPSYNK